MATREIHKIIATLQGDVKNVTLSMEQSSQSVENGVEGVHRSNRAISDIKSHIEVLTENVSQVAAAIEEQSVTTAGVLNNIHAITAIIDDVSHGATKTGTAAAELSATAVDLTAMANKFQV